MPNTKSSKIRREDKAKVSAWDEAIADAKDRIKGLRYSIRVFEARKKTADQWPKPATQN